MLDNDNLEQVRKLILGDEISSLKSMIKDLSIKTNQKIDALEDKLKKEQELSFKAINQKIELLTLNTNEEHINLKKEFNKQNKKYHASLKEKTSTTKDSLNIGFNTLEDKLYTILEKENS